MIRSHHLLYKKNVASRSLSAAATTFRSRLKQLTKRHGSRTPSALPRCCCRACALCGHAHGAGSRGRQPLSAGSGTPHMLPRLLLWHALQSRLGLQQLCAPHVPGAPNAGPRAAADALGGSAARGMGRRIKVFTAPSPAVASLPCTTPPGARTAALSLAWPVPSPAASWLARRPVL